MIETPCPECKGKCCRDDIQTRISHMADEFYWHHCDYCTDGTDRTVPSRTVDDERADVLAYLAYARTFPFTYATSTETIIDCLRELIEQGTHIGWSKREKKE
jgi:hypothetical protein